MKINDSATVLDSEGRLQEREMRLERVISSVPGIVFQWIRNADGSFRCSYVSDACRTLFGIDAPDLIEQFGQSLALMHPNDEPGFLAAMRHSAEGMKPFDWTGRIRDIQTEAYRWWRISSVPVAGNDGAILWDGVLIDVTEPHEVIDALRESEARFRLFAEAGDDVYSLHRRDGVVVYVSPAIQQLTGYAAEECLGHPATRFAHPDDLKTLRAALLRRGENSEPPRIVWRSVGKDATPRWIETTVKRLPRGQSHHGEILCASRDITKSRQREVEAAWRASHDALTGLPNRRYYLGALERAIAAAESDATNLAVVFLDIDGFKRVNDLLGHATGDTLLTGVARLLCEQLRPSDTIARLGGDEFIALLPNIVSRDEPYQVAEQLVAAFHQPIVADGREMFVTASVGVAVYPYDGQDAHALMRAADTAMYEAKASGRNTYQMHTREMQIATHDRMVIEQGLRRMVLSRELSLEYQPIVSLTSGCVTSVEGLLRWTHPQLGAVPCSQFIPVAEDTGLIRSLGEWVLRTACQQAAAWRDRKTNDPACEPVNVAVNLSARQLGQPGIVDQVKRALNDSGLEASLLELELTETALIWNGDSALKTLKSLKDCGIRLAVDDFGAGYSSLAYLRRFPFDAVKIDRSFIADMGDSQTHAIVSAIIDLAHALGITVVAEGVEWEEQRTALHALGCDAMQGWLFSKAVTPDKVPGLMRVGG